jgi:hypothetical protein
MEAAEAARDTTLPLGIVNHEGLDFFLVQTIQFTRLHALHHFMKIEGQITTLDLQRALLVHVLRLPVDRLPVDGLRLNVLAVPK